MESETRIETTFGPVIINYPILKNPETADFTSKIGLWCYILNMDNFRTGDEVISSTKFVQTLPFYVTAKRLNQRLLRIQIVVNDECTEEWSCTFQMIFKGVNEGDAFQERSMQLGNKQFLSKTIAFCMAYDQIPNNEGKYNYNFIVIIRSDPPILGETADIEENEHSAEIQPSDVEVIRRGQLERMEALIKELSSIVKSKEAERNKFENQLNEYKEDLSKAREDVILTENSLKTVERNVSILSNSTAIGFNRIMMLERDLSLFAMRKHSKNRYQPTPYAYMPMPPQ